MAGDPGEVCATEEEEPSMQQGIRAKCQGDQSVAVNV